MGLRSMNFANSSPTTREFDEPALLKQSKKPLLRKGLSYDSDWARTSDLYPVKVALSQLSYGIMICMCCWVCYCLSDKFYYITFPSIRQLLF